MSPTDGSRRPSGAARPLGKNLEALDEIGKNGRSDVASPASRKGAKRLRAAAVSPAPAEIGSAEDELASADGTAGAGNGASGNAASPGPSKRQALGGGRGHGPGHGHRKMEELEEVAEDEEPHTGPGPVVESEAEESSDPEAEVFSAHREVPSFRCSVTGDDDDDDADLGNAAWRRGLEELRRRRAPQTQRVHDPAATELQEDELLQLVRSAVRDNCWTPITAPALLPTVKTVAAVVSELREHELLSLLGGCAQRHESHVRERAACCLWITQALAHRSGHVLGRPELRKTLRPLLAGLARRLGTRRRSGQALSCLGKWKLVWSLARARATVQAADSGVVPGAQESDNEAAAEDEDSSTSAGGLAAEDAITDSDEGA